MRPEILLHPTIPKAIHKLNLRQLLGAGWWNATRQAAHAKHNQHCHACDANGVTLEAHECYHCNYNTYTATYLETVALCHNCHAFIHKGKLYADLQTKCISRAQYDKVLLRGQELLNQLGDIINPYVTGTTGSIWHDWTLLIDGKCYHSALKDETRCREWYY